MAGRQISNALGKLELRTSSQNTRDTAGHGTHSGLAEPIQNLICRVGNLHHQHSRRLGTCVTRRATPVGRRLVDRIGNECRKHTNRDEDIARIDLNRSPRQRGDNRRAPRRSPVPVQQDEGNRDLPTPDATGEVQTIAERQTS